MPMEGAPDAGATPDSGTTSFAAIGDSMWTSLQRHFLMPDPDDHGLYREFYPHIPSARRYAYLWPFSAVLSGANARARLANDEASKADLRRTIETTRQYFDATSDPPGYDSYPVNYGGGDKFYDDNEWIGIDFVYASRTLDAPSLIDDARLVFDFAISGWTDDVLGGGIYWQQFNLESKNTCSNGPAAVLAMLLYEETGEDQYLDWAIRIVDWLDILYDEDTGVFHDNIKPDGTIEPTKWTYNAGTPLHAYALLFRATGDTSWLDRARKLAADSLAHFTSGTTADGAPIFPDTPWFNSILHRGYIALLEVDPDKDTTCVDALPALLNHAWNHGRDEDGFLSPDWSVSGPDSQARRLLDQAPAIEIAASFAEITGQASAPARDTNVRR